MRPGIGVLGDVALPAAVDQDAADDQLRVDQERHLGGVHVGQVGAERLRHLDRHPVVLFDRGSGPAGDPRRIAGHHRLVVGETASGQDDSAPRPHRHLGCRTGGRRSRRPARRSRQPAAAPGYRRCCARPVRWRCPPAASSACSRHLFRRCACPASAARGRAARVRQSCCTGTRFRRRCTSTRRRRAAPSPAHPRSSGLNGTPQSTSQSKCSRLPAQ